MKRRIYFNQSTLSGRPMIKTYGYPVEFPELPGVEFAVVRPHGWIGELEPCWKVIHVRSGKRVGFSKSGTRDESVKIARKLLRRQATVVSLSTLRWRLAREKNPLIIAALAALKQL